MKDLDKLVRLQITEAIENVKSVNNLDALNDKNELESSLCPAGAMGVEWVDFVESLSLYDTDYERIMNNKTSGHRGFSTLHGCG